jgi:hypothetical protein
LKSFKPSESYQASNEHLPVVEVSSFFLRFILPCFFLQFMNQPLILFLKIRISFDASFINGDGLPIPTEQTDAIIFNI